MPDTVIVLDFGSQYNQLIARRIREKGVYSELRPHTMTAEQIRAVPGLKGVVFSGSPKSVTRTPTASTPRSSTSACRSSASATGCSC